MAKYDVKFSCGHIETIELYGPSHSREWKIKQMGNELCSACQAIQDDKNNTTFEAEYELPALDGTDKQVHWARNIRSTFFRMMEKEHADKEINDEKYDKAVIFFAGKTAAGWWIDNRQAYPSVVIKRLWDSINEHRVTAYDPIPQEIDENIIYPEKETSKDIAKIYTFENKVCVRSPKNEDIINVCKECGFSWDSSYNVWKMDMSDIRNGDIGDRIAEIGNAILSEGIAVRIEDASLRERAIHGEFSPRTKRWILVDGLGDMRICWEYGNRKMYDMARALPHSRYERRGVTVDPKYFAEIRDFAGVNGFEISPRAEKYLLDAETADLKKARAVVEKAQRNKQADTHDFKDVLHSSRDILDDLRDD